MATLTRRLATAGCALLLTLMSATAFAEIVVVVSAQNPIQTLSRSELADIYLGRRTQFPHGERIVLIDQRDGSAAHGTFYREFLGRTPAEIKSHWSRLIFTGRGQPPHTVPNGEAVADAVAGHPGAIGYLASEHVDERLQVVRVE